MKRRIAFAVLMALVIFVLVLVIFIVKGCRHKTKPVPSQFTGLPTDSNDYTCAGAASCSTWAMPTKPAPGASYTDPVYGTTTYRLAVPANSSTGNVIPAYSRVQAYNFDGTRLMLSDGVNSDLYDATTIPPTPISQISTTDGSNIDGISGDALWGNTAEDRNLIFFNSPSGSSHGLELRYVDVSACTKESCVLPPVVMHKFDCVSDDKQPIGAGIHGNKIETGSGGQGGMFDATDRYFSFSCDFVNGNGRNEIDLVRYDRQSDRVEQMKWYNICPDGTPASCTVMTSLPKGNNLYRMNQHPDQHYISIIWQSSTSVCPSAESKWKRSCGTEVYDQNYRFLGPVSSFSGHQDWGYDFNGDPVFVGNSNSGGPRDYRALEVVNLKTLDPTRINAIHVLLPCSFSYIGNGCETGTYIGYAKSWHVSMTAWQGRPGWALFSTFMLAGQSAGAPRLPVATTLGTNVVAGIATVTPADMTTIGSGVLSIIDSGSANSEMVTWTATTATTATATFTKPHPPSAPVQCMSCGNTGWGAMELEALKINAAQADWTNFEFYRIGRTYSIRDANYNCEAHGTVSRDFTEIVWGSSWNGDCDTNPQVTAYLLALKEATPQPSAPECSLQLSSDGTVIQDIHCKNLPVTPVKR